MKMKSDTESYVPNAVPKSKRVFGVIWSLFLLLYGVFSFFKGDLWIPGVGAASGISFTGEALIIVLVAIFFSCCNLLLPVIDHFDKRDNEIIYQKLEKVSAVCSVVLVIIASILAHN